MSSYTVQLAFEKLADIGNAFTLDSATRGLLDSATYTLSDGATYVDVTQYVKSINVARGASRELDQFTSGQATVVFNNIDRTFDPEYASSPFYGEIVPKRKIKIYANDILQYVGIIDDWNISYTIDGQSEAVASASDSLGVLSSLVLGAGSYSAQYSGDRINSCLDTAAISWPAEQRDIDTGSSLLGAQTIADETPALEYFQTIETTEVGQLFISKEGNLRFRSRNATDALTGLKFSDDGTGVNYSSIQVAYGSELLYNRIVVTSAIDSSTTISVDTTSQASFGIITLTVDGVLMDSDQEQDDFTNYLAWKYANPEYRFEKVLINLTKQSAEVQNQLLNLELGDLVDISFTPNNIPPAIEKFSQIISINQTIGLDNHIIEYGFNGLPSGKFQLDSASNGILDTSVLGY